MAASLTRGRMGKEQDADAESGPSTAALTRGPGWIKDKDKD